ncbi:unknown [Sutterella sp. CAG:351]|nr:unknown [Sutterella sp. CAG:351]
MDLYIGTRLAGSPFLKTIQSLFRTETGPGRPFLSFGALKEMVRSPAFQANIRAYDQVEVIARWLIYFLPDTYFIPSGLPFALGRRKRIPNSFRTEDQ